MYDLTAFVAIDVAKVANELVNVDRNDLESLVESPTTVVGKGDLKTTCVVLRTMLNPSSDAAATKRIGLARAYSFQSISRFASPCSATT